ncbi:hypothetical protein [Mesorhizobium sp. M0520]|uniref:hypothetical protein n=1 Tax=Mesorhizobium sp. M0520 TaxID=2956957 RepID=UPI00333B75B0
MGKKDDLERLHQHARSLEKSIDDIDLDIERATHDLADRGDPGQLISFLQDRHNAQLGFMYDLGKVEARIEDLESLIREEQEQPQERLLAEQWQEEPLAHEDHLDWFKQSLAENPPQPDEHELAEQRMLQEVEREPSPDDHLD